MCFLVLLALSVQTFGIALAAGQDAIEKMVTFMQALLPAADPADGVGSCFCSCVSPLTIYDN